jgi:NAD-dependent deacetylase
LSDKRVRLRDAIPQAARLSLEADYLAAFTGAGISVESGIPPFRGEKGLWSIYDPGLFEIGYFTAHPEESWPLLKKLFFETFERARPNRAHEVLARLEEEGILRALITQNIDDLHTRAGSTNVVEYHGNSRELVCTGCGTLREVSPEVLAQDLPRCECGAVLKPAFVFFGEDIPRGAAAAAERAAAACDVMLVIGTTGEVYPAASLPLLAKEAGATIIEVNPAPSRYTHTLTDIFLEGEAASVMDELYTRMRGHRAT